MGARHGRGPYERSRARRAARTQRRLHRHAQALRLGGHPPRGRSGWPRGAARSERAMVLEGYSACYRGVRDAWSGREQGSTWGCVRARWDRHSCLSWIGAWGVTVLTARAHARCLPRRLRRKRPVRGYVTRGAGSAIERQAHGAARTQNRSRTSRRFMLLLRPVERACAHGALLC